MLGIRIVTSWHLVRLEGREREERERGERRGERGERREKREERREKRERDVGRKGRLGSEELLLEERFDGGPASRVVRTVGRGCFKLWAF